MDDPKRFIENRNDFQRFDSATKRENNYVMRKELSIVFSDTNSTCTKRYIFNMKIQSIFVDKISYISSYLFQYELVQFDIQYSSIVYRIELIHIYSQLE